MPLGDFFWNACNTYAAFLELYRIDRPVGFTFVILDDFKDSRAFALPRLGLWMLSPKLRHAQSDANFVLHGFGKFQ